MYLIEEPPFICLDFVGWSQDSERFYFIRRQCNENLSESAEETYGLYVYDPDTQEQTLLNAQVLLAWLSPDRQHLFGIVPQFDDFAVGWFNPRGVQVGALTPFQMDSVWLDTNILEIIPFRMDLTWSPDSRNIFLVDADGTAWLFDTEGVGYRLGLVCVKTSSPA